MNTGNGAARALSFGSDLILSASSFMLASFDSHTPGASGSQCVNTSATCYKNNEVSGNGLSGIWPKWDLAQVGMA